MTQGIILAAGMGRRMKGQIGNTPKSMLEVGGRPLIERNIGFMLDAGIEHVAVVVGYEAERFAYLPSQYAGAVDLVTNPDYMTTNTVASLWHVRNHLDRETWISMADILPRRNPYAEFREDRSFYLLRPAAAYEKPDWIAELDEAGRIVSVDRYGTKGHAYSGISHWTQEGAIYIRSLLEGLDMSDEQVRGMYWDEVLLPHLAKFEVGAKLLPDNDYLYEFDDVDDIAAFEREQGLPVSRGNTVRGTAAGE